MDINEFTVRFRAGIENKKIQWLVLSLLLLGIVLTTALDIRGFFQPLRAPITMESFSLPAQVPLQKIADAHLMGIAPLEDTDLPLASLGIVLQGIFLAPNNKSIALIQTSDGKMKAYHVGDTLAANVSIVDILKDYVVVKHNGQLARLTMKIMPLDFSKMTSAQGLFS
jgi:hypothetical protein